MGGNGKVAASDEVIENEIDHGPLISEMRAGEEFIGIYLPRNISVGDFKDKTRGQYVSLQLRDRSGTIAARIWEDGQEAAEEIKVGDPIKIDGVVEIFRENPQVRIRRFRVAREDEINPERLLATTHRNPDLMWGKILAAIENTSTPYEEIASRFKEIPAAKVVHHSYNGGLLEHCFELLVLSETLMQLYPEIDRDMLTTGILLHDIGKLEEYEYEYDVDVTDAGRLIGHVVLSERMVSEAIEQTPGFPPKKAMELIHMIISHHGRFEWGAPRRPKSLEAMALHLLDNLDAQVNRFKLLVSPLRESGKTWTQYDRMLGRVIYAGEENGLTVEENGFAD